MKHFTLLIFLLAVMPALGEQTCDLESIGLEEQSNIARKLYYLGTCNYRNKQYEEAGKLWKRLAALKNVASEYKSEQIDALNNLGYLIFFGYGFKENKPIALGYWHKAIALGHTESEFHLCHAYADNKVSTFDPVKANAHCRKAKLIYQGMDNRDSDQEETLRQIKGYIERLQE